MASVALTRRGYKCDVDNYAGYTNIHVYNDWIYQTVQESLETSGYKVSDSRTNLNKSPKLHAEIGIKLITRLELAGQSSSTCSQKSIGRRLFQRQWPFAAAIYDDEKELFCGGNLITSQHILTGEVQ